MVPHSNMRALKLHRLQDSVPRFKLVPPTFFITFFFNRDASIARNSVRIANNKSGYYCKASTGILVQRNPITQIRECKFHVCLNTRIEMLCYNPGKNNFRYYRCYRKLSSSNYSYTIVIFLIPGLMNVSRARTIE